MKRIKVQINKGEREYDVYALLTSFFPGVEVVTAADATGDFEGQFEIAEEGTKVAISLDFEEYNSTKEYTIISEEKDAAKKEFGRDLYDFLSECTGKELPWGNLTGIRPTKLIRTILEEELSKGAGTFINLNSTDREHNGMGNYVGLPEIKNLISDRLYNERRLRGEKLNLGIDIALCEMNIMSRVHGTDGYSVYVGIPFCPSTCLYCSFTSNPIFKYKNKIKDYLLALKKELEWTAANMGDKFLDTVYIGGGTPTTLGPEELDELLGYITSILPWDNVKEFTIEAGRADSITREKLEVIKKYPINRISVNPQTMSDDTLKAIGRNHSVAQFIEAFNMARSMGFDNINTDIILGLPGETIDDVKHTIDELTKLSPDSLTVHSLAIKRASRLKRWMDENNLETTMDYEAAMRISSEGAKKMGLNPYYLYRQKQMAGNLENTGYASEGKEGLYNILIMEEIQSIVAIGAGSVTKRVYPDGRIERCDNVKDIDLYLNQIDEMIERKKNLFC
ncbi:MAG: coproporphyrinogen dehydrogenase HemZ [Lachnospiraceae bacterium]|nr:coproporphyrinogen dehydrogenase HemZ [Lachnospiraceae bacterium]MBP5275515.1 coproporphyrinogen dehydrogenase HemZ [Lachnospiraceae bacterium]